MKIPFSPPFINDDIIQEVVSCLKSGWITTGPKVKSLQDEIMSFSNAKSVLCVNSWTSGALLVFKWFGLKNTDEVIIPAYTYSATALAVLNSGCKPVMVDVGEDFSINCANVRAAITERTKVIMPVDFAGWPCDYETLNSIVCDESIRSLFKAESDKQKKLGRILLLSDAAHSIGAKYKGQSPVLFSDITIYSFHAVKNITTAEGGAICLNLPSQFDNENEFELMKLFSLNGQNKDAFAKSKLGGWKYDILIQGLKVNMPDICAAIGLSQLKLYSKELLPQRKRVANFYQEYFSQFPWAELPPLKTIDRESSYHLYPLRIKNITEGDRDKIIEEISNLEVGVNVHFIPMPMLTLFKNLNYRISNYPISYDNYSREISLPIYPTLTEENLLTVVNAVVLGYKKIINDQKNI